MSLSDQHPYTLFVAGGLKSPSLAKAGVDVGDNCQEIGLVAFMFFFELLFSYVSLQFPSMFPLLTYSQSFFFLSADYPRHPR